MIKKDIVLHFLTASPLLPTEESHWMGTPPVPPEPPHNLYSYEPASNMNASCPMIAVSSDGSTLVVPSNSGLYYTHNSGATWTKATSTYVPAGNYTRAVVSKSGSVIAAIRGDVTGYWSVSTNGGQTWVSRPGGLGGVKWFGLAMSSGGDCIVGWANTQHIYRSTNYGMTQNSFMAYPPQAGSTGKVGHLAMSGNAQLMVVCPATNSPQGIARISYDAGTTWSTCDLPSDLQGATCTISEDGYAVYLGTPNGRLWKYSDEQDGYGRIWHQLPSQLAVESLACSQDGNTVFLGSYLGLGISHDGGHTWHVDVVGCQGWLSTDSLGEKIYVPIGASTLHVGTLIPVEPPAP